MTRLSTGTMDAYNELRAARAQATRADVLDATMRVMATGVAGLSVPAVAKEAGVSVPTVYRHFRTKRDLLSALYPHVARRLGLYTLPDPRSVDELRPLIRAIVDRLDALDDLSRAAMASPGASGVRHATMPMRYERIGRLADSIEPKLRKPDRERITRLLVVLTASASLRMWRDHLKLSADEVADDVDWIVRAAVGAATERKER